MEESILRGTKCHSKETVLLKKGKYLMALETSKINKLQQGEQSSFKYLMMFVYGNGSLFPYS